MEAISGHIK